MIFCNCSSWDEMIWNITGNVETGSIDSKEELCTRYKQLILYFTGSPVVYEHSVYVSTSISCDNCVQLRKVSNKVQHLCLGMVQVYGDVSKV